MRRLQNTASRQRRGVTLFEAVLVTIILSTSALATSYTLDSQWHARREARNATLDVSRLLTIARNTAIEHRTVVQVSQSVVGTHTQLAIVEQAGPSRPAQSWATPLAPTAKLSGKPAVIQFKPDGSADASASWSVIVDQTQGDVSVAAVNGKVHHRLP